MVNRLLLPGLFLLLGALALTSPPPAFPSFLAHPGPYPTEGVQGHQRAPLPEGTVPTRQFSADDDDSWAALAGQQSPRGGWQNPRVTAASQVREGRPARLLPAWLPRLSVRPTFRVPRLQALYCCWLA